MIKSQPIAIITSGAPTPLYTSEKLVTCILFFYFPFRENLNVNDALMELFILAYACRTACARRIIGMYM